MATKQPPEAPEQQIDITAAEWMMIIVTGFTGIFGGPFAVIPGAIVVGMFTYRLNPELMNGSAAGKWVRAMLPAPAPEQNVSTAKETSSKPVAAATTVQSETRSTVEKVKAAKALPVVELERLAQATTILLVGSRGSGKSTLLRAILATKAAAKESTIAVYDPHAAPGDWPMATMVHNDEEQISKAMTSAYKRMVARRDERRKGIRTSGWPRITLAADEWGSIVAHGTLPKEINLTPGQVSTELMKEGRKYEIGFVAGAHGLTNASLGCTGDQEAFLNSFDWIVNMGAFTRKVLPQLYLDLWDEMPMGKNEQGGTFPLCVACEHRASGELYLLDIRGLDQMVDTSPAQTAPIIPPQRPRTGPDQALLAGMLGAETVSNKLPSLPLVTNDVTKPFDRRISDVTNVTNVTITPQEVAYIADQLARSVAPSDIAKRLKGYTPAGYKAFKAKVDTVKQMLGSQPASDDSPEPGTDESDEPPE